MTPKIARIGSAPKKCQKVCTTCPKMTRKFGNPRKYNRTLPNLKPLKVPTCLNCDEGDEGRNINKMPAYLNCDEDRNINMRSS